MADSLVSRFGCYTIIWDTTLIVARPAPQSRAMPTARLDRAAEPIRRVGLVSSRPKGGGLEVHLGVYVSSTTTNEWEPDPEVGGEGHILVRDEGASAGMSRYREHVDGAAWTLPECETLLVLEGSAWIEIAGGPTLELQVGDMASLPKGAVTTC